MNKSKRIISLFMVIAMIASIVAIGFGSVTASAQNEQPIYWSPISDCNVYIGGVCIYDIEVDLSVSTTVTTNVSYYRQASVSWSYFYWGGGPYSTGWLEYNAILNGVVGNLSISPYLGQQNYYTGTASWDVSGWALGTYNLSAFLNIATSAPSTHAGTATAVCTITCSHTSGKNPASCTTSETCKACGAVTGSALGHASANNRSCTQAETCSRCGTELNPAYGHNYNSSSITTTPTCTQTGVRTYYCANGCGINKTESVAIDDNNHDFSSTSTDASHLKSGANCTAAAVYYKSCSRCGANGSETFTYGDALGHDMKARSTDGGYKRTNASCTAAATYYYSCTKCYATDTTQWFSSGSVLEHSWNSGEITTQPSCTTDGVKTFTCTVCSTTKTEAVAKLGHAITSHEAKDPTCTEVGWYAYDTCSRCSYSTYSERPSTGHAACDWVIVNPATCTATGLKTKTCPTCKTVIDSATIDMVAHTVVTDSALPASCTADGLTQGSHCSVCKAVIIAQETVPATGHDSLANLDWVVVTPATCTSVGLQKKTCTKCHTILTTKEIPKVAHTEVIDQAVPASCTETGLTQGSHCSVCKEVIIAQTTVSATGHTEVIDQAVPATCLETGLTQGKHCSVCKAVLLAQEVVPALDHQFTAQVQSDTYLRSEATCTEKATYFYKCSRCAEKGSTYYEYGNALGHNYNQQVVSNDYLMSPADCTHKAVYYYKCDRCSAHSDSSKTFENGDVLGHDWNDGEVTAAPDCTNAGVKTFTCKRAGCGQTRTEAVSATGHTPGPAATCTTDQECTVCHAILTAKLRHTFTEEVQTATYLKSAATCLEKAIYYYKCVRCDAKSDDTKTYEYGEPLNHDFTDQVQNDTYLRSEATCTEKATYFYKCSRCAEKGLTYYEFGNVLGHTYNQQVVSNDYLMTPADCTHKAVYFYKCERCSAHSDSSKTFENGDVLGHDWNDGEVTTPPDCTNIGVKTFTCKRTGCGATKTENVAATGHTPGVAATCTTAQECTVCHTVLNPSKGHGACDWVVITPATCSSKGLETKTCPDCLQVIDSRDIEMLPHTEVTDDAVPASCTESGLTQGKHCAVCKEVIVAQQVIPATGHTPGPIATCTTDQICTVCKSLLNGRLGHDFTVQEVTDDYLKSPADSLNAAIYYYKCSRCDAYDENFTYSYGEPIPLSVTVTWDVSPIIVQKISNKVWDKSTLTWIDDEDHIVSTDGQAEFELTNNSPFEVNANVSFEVEEELASTFDSVTYADNKSSTVLNTNVIDQNTHEIDESIITSDSISATVKVINDEFKNFDKTVSPETYGYFTVTINKNDGSSCVLKGTKVTMADGSKKNIENIKVGDEILSYNFFDGSIKEEKVLKVITGKTNNDVITNAKLSNGSILKVCGTEYVFDTDKKEYIPVSSNISKSLIGKNILVNNNGRIVKAKIVDTFVTNQDTEYFSIYSTGSNNYIANDVIAHSNTPFINDLFTVGENYKIDEVKLHEDVVKYGLYSYEDFKDILSEKEFDEYKIRYAKILVGKGYLTDEEICNVVKLYCK